MPRRVPSRPAAAVDRHSPARHAARRVRPWAPASACRNRRHGRLVLLDEHRHGVGELGAAFLPEVDAVEREPHTLFAFAGDRIVETYALDETAVPTRTRVRNDDVVKGALLCAATCKADDNHD